MWDLWAQDGGSQGLSFARARLDATERVLVHALPAALRVEVFDEEGRLQARGADLRRTADTPMARLLVAGTEITREDVWPDEADLGTPVILAGGEAGILERWWHAADHSEWRWSIELYNHR